MEKVTSISEICNLICKKLIECGVREYVAWTSYGSEYVAIIKYFENHGEKQFNQKLLIDYQSVLKNRYDKPHKLL